jgi:hypothetical protein
MSYARLQADMHAEAAGAVRLAEGPLPTMASYLPARGTTPLAISVTWEQLSSASLAPVGLDLLVEVRQRAGGQDSRSPLRT